MASFACIYSHQGRIIKAEELEQPVLEAYRVLYGPDHNKTLEAEADLRYTVTYNPDRLSEAEALQVDVLQRLEITVGPDSPSIVTVIDQLGMTYLKQRRFDQSIIFEKEVIGAAEIGGDLEHDSHVHALGNLASYHKARGNVSEAETLEKLIARMQEEKLASHDNGEGTFGTQNFWLWM